MLLICSNFPLLATVTEYNYNDVNKNQGSGFVVLGFSFKLVLIPLVSLLKLCQIRFWSGDLGFTVFDL